MKLLFFTVLVALGLAGIGAPDVSPALAQTVHRSDSFQSCAPLADTSSPADPGVGTNSSAGAYAAVGCGLFSRALTGGMVNVGVIAGAIATCAFMFIDGLFF